MHLRLPGFRGPAASFVPVRQGMQLRPDLHLQRLPARERTPSGEPAIGYGGAAWYVAYAIVHTAY
jgi:hypothetical protein